MSDLSIRERATRVRDAIAISVADARPEALGEVLHEIAVRGPANPRALAATVENKRLEKHDVFLRDSLLDLDYAAKRLDTVGAHRAAVAFVRGARRAG